MNYQLRSNEIRAALSAIEPNHNLWRAFMSMLEEAIEGELSHVCNPILNDALSHFNRGRFAMLHDFRTACEGYMKEATKIRQNTDAKR